MKEISDFSTSVMWRNVKLIHMWRNFRFLHICHVQKFEISPHDRFFLHGHRPPCPRQISGMNVVAGFIWKLPQNYYKVVAGSLWKSHKSKKLN